MKELKRILTAILVVLAFTFTTNINAQTGNGNVDGDLTRETGINDDIAGNCGHGPNQHAGNACDGGSDSIPLDGGLSILVLGAAAFGIRKLRGNKEDK